MPRKKTPSKGFESGPGTAAVWAGETELSFQGATQTPVVHSVTYAFEDLEEWFEVALGKKEGHIYSRNTNPTVGVLEEKIRHLESAEASTSFATGMAAISNTLFSLLSPGKRVVSIKDSYGGTSRIFMEFLPRYNVDVSLCDTSDHDEIETQIVKGCDVLYLESPTNPTLKILDISRLADAARRVGAIVVVDNTFATPINQNPLRLGADLVIHSATKYLGGHSDALGGLVCGRKNLIDRIYQFREINGSSLDAMSAYLILRGMKTLELRVLRQNENALTLAEFLRQHSAVEEVFYPGLASHSGHATAARQMRGFGGVLSFSLKGGFENVEAFLHGLKFAHLAASLGSVGTLVGPPKTTSHVETSAEERESLGIPENLIRYSTGIENAEDLLKDLEGALGLL